MKRVIYIVIALVFVLMTLSGCGGSKAITEENNSSLPAISQESQENTDQDDEAEAIAAALDELQKDGRVNISLGEMGENMALPESYPEEVFPLLEDANIININENKDFGDLGIIYKTSKSFEDAIAYYEELMKDQTIDIEGKQEDSYFLMGSKDGVPVSVSISKLYDGSVSILVGVKTK